MSPAQGCFFANPDVNYPGRRVSVLFRVSQIQEKNMPHSFFTIPLTILAISGCFVWWIWKKLPPDSPFSMSEKRTLGVLAGIMGCGTFIVLIGGFDLSLSMLRFPDVGFGRGVIEITGSNRLDGVSRFKYLYYFCLWFGLLSPLVIGPAAILLRKRKVLLLSLLCLLPVFSYFEVNTGVQAGFHYRAQLLERFGKDRKGYLAADRLMPPDIRQEYAGGPRSKTCKVAALLGWACWPFWNLLCFPVVLLVMSLLFHVGPKTERKDSE